MWLVNLSNDNAVNVDRLETIDIKGREDHMSLQVSTSDDVWDIASFATYAEAKEAFDNIFRAVTDGLAVFTIQDAHE